jgi:hypothetical protein
VKGERLDDLFASSAELGTAFNAVLDGDEEATWLFTFCGAAEQRDLLADALQGLGLAEPYQGRAGAHLHEIEDASRKTGGMVIHTCTSHGRACLAACLVGEPEYIAAHALRADEATAHTAQEVHVRRVDLGGRPDRPHHG